MAKKIPIIVVLSIILLATSWSLLSPHLFRVHDYIHAARVAEMARGLVDGQFPVRWSRNFGFGYGLPLFEFYAPLPYFVGALLWLSGTPIEIVVRLLFLIPSAITVFAAYTLGRVWFNQRISLLVAATISLAPYRALNLYVRGAVSEAWGMSFMLVTLLGINYIVRKQRFGFLITTVGMVGLVLSHNLTAMIAAPVFVIWMVLALIVETRSLYQGTFRWKSFARVTKESVPSMASSALLAIGLTAFYWLPALMEKRFTQLDQTILTGYFDYRIHFLSVKQFFMPFWGYGGSSWGLQDDISFFLGYGQIAGCVLTGIAFFYSLWLTRKMKNQESNKQLVTVVMGWGLILSIAVFLSIQRSLPIWEFVSVLHTLQFPWRFLSIISVMTGLLSVVWLTIIRKNHSALAICTSVLFVVMLLNARYFQPETYLANDSELYYTDAGRIQLEMSKTLPDFQPATFLATTPAATLITCPDTSDCTVMSVRHAASNQFSVEVHINTDTTLHLATAAYPGWVVQIDGKDTNSSISEVGEITVPMSRGTHQVRWYFGSTYVRQIADSISALFVFVTIATGYYALKRSAIQRHRPEQSVTPYLMVE